MFARPVTGRRWGTPNVRSGGASARSDDSVDSRSSNTAARLVEAITAILLGAAHSEQQAADGYDCLGRLIIGHTLAEAGRAPASDVDGGEQQHRQAQQALPAERYPALARVRRAGVRHDPDRLFDLALDGLLLALGDRSGDAADGSTDGSTDVDGRADRPA
jgi:Tetracyclin repressor-like, C-terminal domain